MKGGKGGKGRKGANVHASEKPKPAVSAKRGTPKREWGATVTERDEVDLKRTMPRPGDAKGKKQK